MSASGLLRPALSTVAVAACDCGGSQGPIDAGDFAANGAESAPTSFVTANGVDGLDVAGNCRFRLTIVDDLGALSSCRLSLAAIDVDAGTIDGGP